MTDHSGSPRSPDRPEPWESQVTVESSIREAVVDELKRQAENSDGRLSVEVGEDVITIRGPVDLDDLIMVVMGSVAGGP